MTSSSHEQQIRLALDCWYVTGATASGKTPVAIHLAEILGAEIISLDSMAIYRGMDIGTAKPSAEQRARVPHHLLDVADPVEEFTVTRYREMALEKIAEIRARGREVIFAGGTALYLKAMLRGIFTGPPADHAFRDEIERELAEVGLEPLYRRLQQVDPVSASWIHPNDKRRIIRALEVYSTTGTPISHLQTEFETAHSRESCRVFTLRHPRETLHDRIAARVQWMFDNGLVNEVQRLLDRWGELGRTARQAVGYRETIAHLQDGVPLEETRQRTLFRTRQFARHQETWFRGLEECRMLDLPETFGADPDAPCRLAAEIARAPVRAA
jgi:tRNA dimethylallyltransferase